MKFDYFDMLSGQPITVPGIGKIRSPKLSEICPASGAGYSEYNIYLNFLAWGKDGLLKYDKLINPRGAAALEKALDKLSTFDVATLLPQTRAQYLLVLDFFMDNTISWDEEARKFIVSEQRDDDSSSEIVGEITKDNFDNVRKMMLQMNYIGLEQKDNLSPIHSSESAKQLWERAQGYLKKQAESSSGSDKPEYRLGNIISKLCAVHPSYNLTNVFDLTVFQVYDAFFQVGFLKSSELSERIFSIHGGDKFRFEDWLKPIIKN